MSRLYCVFCLKVTCVKNLGFPHFLGLSVFGGWLLLLTIFGPTFGVLFLAILLILLSLVVASYRLPNRLWITRLRRCFYGVFLLWLLSLVGMMVLMFSEHDGPTPARGATVIVLGAGLKDGKHLSLILESRLQKALELVRRDPSLHIIVSGGRGSDEHLSEAAAMQQYLLAHGVSSSKIQLENRSTTTQENLQFSRQLLLQQGPLPQSLVVLTSDFHLYRAKQIALRQGLKVSGIRAQTPLWVLINYATREYFALLKFWIG